MSKHIRVTVFEEDGSSYDLVDTRKERPKRKPARRDWLTVPASTGGPGPRSMPVVKKGPKR